MLSGFICMLCPVELRHIEVQERQIAQRYEFANGVFVLREVIQPTHDESLAIRATQQFYEHPNPGIYSLKPGLHKEVQVEAYGRSASIDEGLVEIIKGVWKHDWETLGSCEERPKSGRAYISFPVARHGREFAALLGSVGIEHSVEEKSNRLSTSSPFHDVILTSIVDSLHVFFARRDFERIVAELKRGDCGQEIE